MVRPEQQSAQHRCYRLVGQAVRIDRIVGHYCPEGGLASSLFIPSIADGAGERFTAFCRKISDAQ